MTTSPFQSITIATLVYADTSTARESQYKSHFRKWRSKKNISAVKKTAMCDIHRGRAKIGKATVFEDSNGQIVDPKKLRRHLKNNMRREFAWSATVHEQLSRVLSPGPSQMMGNNV